MKIENKGFAHGMMIKSSVDYTYTFLASESVILLCSRHRNLEYINTIRQYYTYLGSTNNRVSCSLIPGLKLEAWRETPQTTVEPSVVETVAPPEYPFLQGGLPLTFQGQNRDGQLQLSGNTMSYRIALSHGEVSLRLTYPELFSGRQTGR